MTQPISNKQRALQMCRPEPEISFSIAEYQQRLIRKAGLFDFGNEDKHERHC